MVALVETQRTRLAEPGIQLLAEVDPEAVAVRSEVALGTTADSGMMVVVPGKKAAPEGQKQEAADSVDSEREVAAGRVAPQKVEGSGFGRMVGPESVVVAVFAAVVVDLEYHNNLPALVEEVVVVEAAAMVDGYKDCRRHKGCAREAPAEIGRQLGHKTREQDLEAVGQQQEAERDTQPQVQGKHCNPVARTQQGSIQMLEGQHENRDGGLDGMAAGQAYTRVDRKLDE